MFMLLQKLSKTETTGRSILVEVLYFIFIFITLYVMNIIVIIYSIVNWI